MSLTNFINYSNREFTLQWHITNKCDMKCSHCYITPSKKNDVISFDLKRAKEIVFELYELKKHWQIPVRINFTGGNPLLSEYFWELSSYASSLDIRIGILGNPTSLMDDKTLLRLKEIPVYRYQISIDGLKENHELIRGEGSYEIAIKAVETLISNNIPSVVLSTVTKKNLDDIPILANLMHSKGVTVFDFARIVPTGGAKEMWDFVPEPNEYRSFLLKMFNTYRNIVKIRPNAYWGTKDPLWMLLFSDLGLLRPKSYSATNTISGGCSIGINEMCIDADFTAYSCRRLEIPIGNLMKHSIYDLFINSSELNKQREYPKDRGCSSCELFSICRGCRAISYSISGDFFSKDPSCWKYTK